VEITGGASWTSYSLDPVKGELYVPCGNPALENVVMLNDDQATPTRMIGKKMAPIPDHQLTLQPTQ